MLTISVFLNMSSPYLTQISASKHVIALNQKKKTLNYYTVTNSWN